MLTTKGKYVYLNGRIVGELEGDAIIMKRVRSKHHYRVLNAWCVNTEVVAVAPKKLAVKLSDGDRYVISIHKVDQLRSKLNLFVTMGTERQLAIPLECWDYYAQYSPNHIPQAIGLSAEEFVSSPDGRWKSRLIAYGQTEIKL
jgi:hypothetical protein